MPRTPEYHPSYNATDTRIPSFLSGHITDTVVFFLLGHSNQRLPLLTEQITDALSELNTTELLPEEEQPIL
jgi:hypothetical protein